MQADPTIGLMILTLVPTPLLLPVLVIGAGVAFGVG